MGELLGAGFTLQQLLGAGFKSGGILQPLGSLDLPERPQLTVPGPKDANLALMKIQKLATNEFQMRNGILKIGTNRLSKVKYCEFQKVFADFCENEPSEVL